MVFVLPLGSIFPAQKKHVCHCATKTGRGIVFHGHYPQVIVEQLELTLHCKRIEKNSTDGGDKEGEEGE